jgi:hypothetical protein
MEETKNAIPAEAKLHIQVNEDAENRDFTFIVPKECSFEYAKKSIIGLYEYVIRLEIDAVRAKQAQDAKEAADKETPELNILSASEVVEG